MKTAIFPAAVLSVILLTGGASAQGSNTGTPNTLHGSGDMMQDGPHASSNPNAVAEGSLPSGKATGTYQTRHNACEKRWNEAQKNGIATTTTHSDFMTSCMSS